MPSPTSGSTSTMGTRTEVFKIYSSTYVSVTHPTQYWDIWSRYSMTTPGFHNTAWRSGLPFNKYGYSIYRVENWYGVYQELQPSNNNYSLTVTGTFGSFNELADGFTSLERVSASDEAVGKALNRVKDQTANWAENIATSKQTLRMIATNISRVANAWRAARQGNLAKAAAHLGVSLRGPGRVSTQSKAIANGWLELQYGWLPLLQDIYQTTIAIQDRRRKKEPLFRVSAVVSRQKNRQEVRKNYDADVTLTHDVRLTAKVILYFRLENEDLRLASQMGITNPIALAWELLPFSFVLDWLLPVGNYFSNLDATLGTRFVRGGITIFEHRKLTGSCYSTGRKSGGSIYNTALSAKYEHVAVNRDPLVVFPSQKVPHFKDPVSGKHLANAMALVRQSRL